MTDPGFRYDTPAAFRSAIKDRFRQIAQADQRYTLDELQRQFAYDRALARLFTSDDAEYWVLKGAGALLARLAIARHSKDVDVLFWAADAEVDDAVDALQAALRIDLGDHFRFEATRVTALQEEANVSSMKVIRPPGQPIRRIPGEDEQTHRLRDLAQGRVQLGSPGRELQQHLLANWWVR